MIINKIMIYSILFLAVQTEDWSWRDARTLTLIIKLNLILLHER